MATLVPSPAPVLEPAASELARATDPHPRIYELDPPEGRDALAGLQTGEGVGKPAIDGQWAEADAGRYGRLRVRIVRPEGATGTLPVIMYIHGAGSVFGDENTHDRLVRELAVRANAAVLFPVYTRAPEARYPTQIEQNYAVGQWLKDQGPAMKLDPGTVAVCGDSVGGNMSTVFAMMNAERGGLSLKCQVLLYPVTDANFDTPSYQQFSEGYYLTLEGMKWFWDQYTADPAQRADPHASPLRASLDQLRSMPPTLVITDEADVLRDEGEAYAARLREAGIPVTAVRVLGVVHDFMMLDSLRDTAANNVALKLAGDTLRDALHGWSAATIRW
ncbi:alpha/beta hydrolase [Streptomyces sp. GS7]|uniref:alpha/beta hydrolase n=1 Tax=Streptomyces sp. GS7 TaxID=2692234 RepID=UPI0013161317|nr:alpha/beta hydrolase [Streptomyces sp. GS7]QHC23290.1 alpha/beta hydrolase fold domain-containing protein [Streptomyces sp. GS7]